MKTQEKTAVREVFFTTAVGIVAEYNPFHSGHARQLALIRGAFGEDTPVVAVLSGDFVQRGEAACFSKSARAEAAVRCGVSLVLELPLPWCLSSAEGFARGAVGLLRSAGVVDVISFGSESADLASLRRCAEALDSPAFPAALRERLKNGAPFAAARERALADLTDRETAACLGRPNDLLAVEYIRAAGPGLGFFPVQREGPDHDGAGSALSLRASMASGDGWLESVPPPARAVFEREARLGRGPVTEETLCTALMARLRDRGEEDYARVPDVSEGLEHRLFRAVREETSPSRAAMAAKSRRYALSRLRRALMCAALGVEKDMAQGTPPYLRVLAMDGRGEALLRRMKKNAALPLVTRSGSVLRQDEPIRAVFELGSRAHDLYVLGFGAEDQRRGGEDYRTAPFIAGREPSPAERH